MQAMFGQTFTELLKVVLQGLLDCLCPVNEVVLADEDVRLMFIKVQNL